MTHEQPPLRALRFFARACLCFFALTILLTARLAHAQSALEWAIAQGSQAAQSKQAQSAHIRLAPRIRSPPLRRAASADLAGGQLVRASWYGGGEKLNRRTASGEVFRPSALTAAHRTLPFGALLVVSFGGRSIIVRVNDRGPAAWTGRSLDLSRAAARALGFAARGEAFVHIRKL